LRLNVAPKAASLRRKDRGLDTSALESRPANATDGRPTRQKADVLKAEAKGWSVLTS
jgi:hypothetical protein